ncbi:MAG: HK97 gp10 family phage protein [Romboutsia sp.]|nr:HK97 gp10 family phage protein [Romboutsia sp.]
MEIQGLTNFIRTLNSASNNFDEEANKRLNNVSQKLIAKVKLKTPVDSGVLRRSWRAKKDGDLARIVYNKVKYGSMVEYGHRTRGGKSFVDGRYMLTKSVKEIEDTLTSEFSIMIEDLFNR